MFLPRIDSISSGDLEVTETGLYWTNDGDLLWAGISIVNGFDSTEEFFRVYVPTPIWLQNHKVVVSESHELLWLNCGFLFLNHPRFNLLKSEVTRIFNLGKPFDGWTDLVRHLGKYLLWEGNETYTNPTIPHGKHFD